MSTESVLYQRDMLPYMRLHWQGERAQLWQGDARWLDALGNGSAHLVVTSPPYWNAKQECASWPSYEAYLADMALAWAECFRVLRDGGRIAVNVPDGYGRPGNGGYRLIGDDTARALQAAGFTLRGKVIWHKGSAVARNSFAWGSWRSASNPALRDCHEVILIGHKGAARRAGPATIAKEDFLAATVSVWEIQPAHCAWHPAPFPAELARRLMELYSFPGDVILDPFAGTGTTIWEAERAGRSGIGVELREEYLNLALEGRY